MAIHALKLKPETLIGYSAFDINTFKYAFQFAAKRSVLMLILSVLLFQRRLAYVKII